MLYAAEVIFFMGVENRKTPNRVHFLKVSTIQDSVQCMRRLLFFYLWVISQNSANPTLLLSYFAGLLVNF